MAFLGVGVFIALFFKLFSLQILRHDELEAKALDQQTRSTVVTATRGTIYDRNGNIMAISATAETVFLSPLEMNRALNDKDALLIDLQNFREPLGHAVLGPGDGGILVV